MRALRPGDDNEKPVFLFVERDDNEAIYASVAERGVYTTEEWRQFYGQLAEVAALFARCANCDKRLVEDAVFEEVAPGVNRVARWRFCAVVDRGEIAAYYCWDCAPPRSKRAFLLTKNADQ